MEFQEQKISEVCRAFFSPVPCNTDAESSSSQLHRKFQGLLLAYRQHSIKNIN